MESVNSKNFGLIIAYILPGFIGINGLAYKSVRLKTWMGLATFCDGPTIGGFLILGLASVFVGLIASTLRWMTIDLLIHMTGVTKPDWDFGNLSENLPAFETLIDAHYRYYQFYANSVVAVIFYMAMLWHQSVPKFTQILLFAGLITILFLGARDTLRKYYRRVGDFLAKERQINIITGIGP